MAKLVSCSPPLLALHLTDATPLLQPELRILIWVLLAEQMSMVGKISFAVLQNLYLICTARLFYSVVALKSRDCVRLLDPRESVFLIKMSSEVHFENGPVDTSSLKGKSVIITGGSSGMGRMQSVNWASAGAYVTVADVQDKMGNELVKEITASGGKATYVHCDVTNYESSAAAFKHAIEFSPSKTLDIAVLYAGVIGDARNLVEIVEANGPPSIDKVPTPPSQAAMTINLLGMLLPCISQMAIDGQSHCLLTILQVYTTQLTLHCITCVYRPPLSPMARLPTFQRLATSP